MKVITSMLVLCLSFCLSFVVKANPTPLITTEKDIFEYLTEFEGYLLATGMKAGWKSKERIRWRSECVSGKTAADASKVLLTLSENMLETSMQAGWEKDKWIADCKAATSAKQIASLLISFENNTVPTAINPSWETRKAKWEAECIKAPFEAESAVNNFMHEK